MNAAKGPISHTTSQKHNFALTIFVLLFKEKKPENKYQRTSQKKEATIRGGGRKKAK